MIEDVIRDTAFELADKIEFYKAKTDDQVIKIVNGELISHELFFIPKKVDVLMTDEIEINNILGYRTVVKVQYTLMSADGTLYELESVGEGVDLSKSTEIALKNAYKNACAAVFSLREVC